MANIIDHLEKIDGKGSLLAQQYQDSLNLKAYLTALLTQANELETVFCSIADMLDLDNATAAQLDIIGEIVGQPRIFIPQLDPDTFTFDIGPGFDEGLFIVNDGFLELTDDDYRRFIRARIASNTNQITPEDIITNIRFIFGEDTEVFFTDGNLEYIVSIGQQLTLADRYLLSDTDIIPRTAAVNGRYGVAFDETSFRFDVGLGFDVGLFATEI